MNTMEQISQALRAEDMLGYLKWFARCMFGIGVAGITAGLVNQNGGNQTFVSVMLLVIGSLGWS